MKLYCCVIFFLIVLFGDQTFASVLNPKEDRLNSIKRSEKFSDSLQKQFSFFNHYRACYDINWASWSSFTGRKSVGTIQNGSDLVNVTMTANYDFSSTPEIYSHSKFDGYPALIPNRTVPQTTWSAGTGGLTTMCFSKTVTNPVLLISSLGNSAGLRATLNFSLPYVILFDGGNMEYPNNKSLIGTEGFAIIMFPGEFSCVDIISSTPEFYTNITWGIRPAPFNLMITDQAIDCESVKLTASGGISYKWSGGDSPNVSENVFHQSGIYTVTATDINGCTTSTSKEVKINPTSASIISSTNTCGFVTLTASGGSSYLWDGGEKPNEAENIFKTSGRYSVIIKNDLGCSTTISKEVIVVQPMTLSNAGSDLSFCNASSTTLSANQVSLIETGTWSVTSPQLYNPFDASNRNNPNATITNIPPDVDVFLKWTITNTTCQTTSESTLKIRTYTSPILVLPASLTVMEGQSVQIPAGVTSPGNFTFQWSPITGLSNPLDLKPIAKPEQTTIYDLSIRYGSGCLVKQSIKIIVDKITKINACVGKSVHFAGDANNDNTPVFQWQFSTTGNWQDIAAANLADFDIASAENQSNIIQIISYRRKVSADQSIYYDSKFELSIPPEIKNNQISTVQLRFCAESVENLLIDGSTVANSGNAILAYSWAQSTDGSTWNPITGEISKDLKIARLQQTVFLRREVLSGNCLSISDPIHIELFAAPTIAAAGTDQMLCGNKQVALDANEPANGETGAWTVISPINYQPFSDSSLHNPKAIIDNLPEDEPIVLQWKINNNNCNTFTVSEVKIQSYKDLTVQYAKSYTMNFGEKLNFNLQADLSPNVDYTFDWTPKKGLNTYDVLNPVASPSENTNYTLQINYGADCLKTISLNVTVLNEIKVPSSFTPNGDGINDHWIIKNFSNYPGSKVSVYNRYGATVYQTLNYLTPWDGTFKGQQISSGTYFYVIQVKDKNSTIINGSLTIIR